MLNTITYQVYLAHQFIMQSDLEIGVCQLRQRPKLRLSCRTNDGIYLAHQPEQRMNRWWRRKIDSIFAARIADLDHLVLPAQRRCDRTSNGTRRSDECNSHSCSLRAARKP